MNRDGRDAAAGAVGGLVAGAVLSGMMLLLERSGRGPSDFVLMERRGARVLGAPHRRMGSAPDTGEQIAGHAGHLLFSTALGSGLGLLRRGLGTTAPRAGLVLGLSFYPVAFGLLGPLLGLTRPPWRERPSKIGQNVLLHAVFGAVTGFVADRIERRWADAPRGGEDGHRRPHPPRRDVEATEPDAEQHRAMAEPGSAKNWPGRGAEPRQGAPTRPAEPPGPSSTARVLAASPA